jgi:hypothetical protein
MKIYNRTKYKKLDCSSEQDQICRRASIDQDLLGIMVWYASVKNGFDYAPFWDASTKEDSISGYKAAYQLFKAANGKPWAGMQLRRRPCDGRV